jgi:hypothetical protein
MRTIRVSLIPDFAGLMQVLILAPLNFLKDIVASDSYTDKKLPLAASWSQREDILAVLSELQHSPVS